MPENGEFKSIRIYDDMAKAKREFVPIDGNEVKMYVCGVTVYDHCHLGHARTYVVFDVIRRYLEYAGYTVKHVQNFTDIDDKIIARARERGVTESELAGEFIEEYFATMDGLRVKRATQYPRATETVPQIVEMIEQLVKKGFAYESDGDVLFKVGAFPGYGRLSGHTGAGVEKREIKGADRKRDKRDFALWKKAANGDPSWESPWGGGRPGWHIECSAMIREHLGDTIDIHGGGNDLMFPHHENEIAQSEAATGKPFVNYWIHSGFVQVDGEKMSKSLGNMINVAEILDKYSSDTLRLCFLKSHYRMPLNFSEALLEDARAGMERFRTFFDSVDAALSSRKRPAPLKNDDFCEFERNRSMVEAAMEDAMVKFHDAMNDDFNTPEALAAMYELVRAGNGFSAEVEKSQRGACCEPIRNALRRVGETVKTMGRTLGLFETDADAAAGSDAKLLEKLIETILSVRQQIRRKKDWELSDQIRDEMMRLGIVVEDRPGGPTWRIK